MTLARLAPALVLGAALVGGLLVVRTCRAQEDAAPFENVQLLKHVQDKKEMRAIMKEQAKALGVKCTYCHVQGKFGLDDKDEKKTARAMMEMVRDLNAKYFTDMEQGLSCWTCHRGEAKPQLTRPADAETEPAGFQAADE